MKRLQLMACVVISTTLSIGHVYAGSFSVSQTSLSVLWPDRVSTFSVGGKGKSATKGQIRVLRWTQIDGHDDLQPTRDVVVSPPALTLEPGRELTVRLMRTVETPVSGEECYRVLVDQLPGAEQKNMAVQFTIRQSIPLCFDSPEQHTGKINWQLMNEDGRLSLVGSNDGERRLVARNVVLKSSNGEAVKLGAAVVLGKSTMSWPIQSKLGKFANGSNFTLTATIGSEKISIKGIVGGG